MASQVKRGVTAYSLILQPAMRTSYRYSLKDLFEWVLYTNKTALLDRCPCNTPRYGGGHWRAYKYILGIYMTIKCEGNSRNWWILQVNSLRSDMCPESALDMYTRGRLRIDSSIMKAEFEVLSIALMTSCVFFSFKLSLDIKNFVKHGPCQHKNPQLAGARNIPKEAGKITGNVTKFCNKKWRLHGAWMAGSLRVCTHKDFLDRLINSRLWPWYEFESDNNEQHKIHQLHRITWKQQPDGIFSLSTLPR